jgi:hypothetical protein
LPKWSAIFLKLVQPNPLTRANASQGTYSSWSGKDKEIPPERYPCTNHISPALVKQKGLDRTTEFCKGHPKGEVHEEKREKRMAFGQGTCMSCSKMP